MAIKTKYYAEMISKLKLQSLPRLWNYAKYKLLRRKAVVKHYTPQLACLPIIGKCNLNCYYCNAGNLTDKPEMTFEQLVRIMENPLFKSCIIVDLEGGETLLAKDLDRMIRWLSDRGYIVNIGTNGLLLTPERARELKEAGLARINVSLYPTNISRLQLSEVNEIFPVHTSIVLTKTDLDNPDELINRISFAQSANCLDVRFWNYRPVGKSPNKADLVTEDLPSYISFRKRVDELFPGFCLWAEPVKDNSDRSCSQCWQRIAVFPTGEMAICPGTDVVMPDVNLFTSTTDEIYNHQRLVRMRAGLIDGSLEPVCKTCNLLNDKGW